MGHGYMALRYGLVPFHPAGLVIGGVSMLIFLAAIYFALPRRRPIVVAMIRQRFIKTSNSANVRD